MASSSDDVKCGVYDVNLPSRAIAPIHNLSGDTQSYFLVGSCAAHDGTTRNQICVLSYGEDRRDVNCASVVNHNGEIISITTPGNATGTDDITASSAGGASASSTTGSKLFATTHTTDANPNDITSTIYKLADDYSSLKTVAHLPQGTSHVAWHPLKLDSNEVRVVLSENEIGIANFDASAGAASSSASQEATIITKYALPGVTTTIGPNGPFSANNRLNTLMTPTVMAWDPIHNDRIIAARGSNLYQIDTRSKSGAVASSTPTTIVNSNGSSSTLLCGTAHGFGAIRSVHCNRNELHLVVTGGDDGMISFWDLRRAGNGPLLSKRVHDHAVQKVSFNRLSDKTLLTCSSDRSSKVWSLGAAAVPWGHNNGGDDIFSTSMGGGGVGLGDSIGRGGGFGGNSPSRNHAGNNNGGANNSSSTSGASLGEFGDAVLDCCWSSLTPFVTAAVSYNGKVIIGTVSKSTRDGIFGIA